MITDTVAIVGLAAGYLLAFWWLPSTWVKGPPDKILKLWLLDVARLHVWTLLIVWLGYSLFWLIG